ncbi:hypothetical protein LX64_03403 [Chitinophaga skermanii]|uniref:Uncharacterized protein n=1 Tax=Chitinophaga skermanii TaxID=331697 RepID=A0A327QD34_9BACT|nr:hypothetical protein LX64_03403 [Chitinophaga skermanii]
MAGILAYLSARRPSHLYFHRNSGERMPVLIIENYSSGTARELHPSSLLIADYGSNTRTNAVQM